MPSVDYDHSRNSNSHTVLGASAALGALFGTRPPRSMLDVGCGRGTWLRAALNLGVCDIYGIDGGTIDDGDLLFPKQFFRTHDLCEEWDLERQFDAAFCLEVAEHLPSEVAPKLIASIVKHSETIFFSAAVPGQAGQHHVNCQWPEYWQKLFNIHGFACSDTLRWMIWDIDEIEPWYRQNMFQASYSPNTAGKEVRIRAVIHPEMLDRRVSNAFRSGKIECISRIEQGEQRSFWYVSVISKAIIAKLTRKLANR